MNIDIHDPSQILSHVLLHDMDLAQAVAATPGFVEGKQIIPAVTFNDVAVDPEIFEAALKELYKQVGRHFEAKYADVEAEVERRLKQRLQEEADEIINRMHQLTNALEHAGELIKPYWEK